ncbi:dirigent protein 21-like isoform X1 [Rhododendron vialii]|uniref:dirigent protein 21-like isoform X1 n=1 Tax=Rhododendron vialii TaxID=182163 RepID=UPI00265DBF2F|nr:dirigent protein 21-like isoform X1 [Rhododendron vialii]
MGAVGTILVLCSMVVIAMPTVHGIDESPQAVEKWFEELGRMKEKVTKIHFYLHDTVNGNNISAVEVAGANVTSQSPTANFGSVYVVDDPLTVGPELNSTILGRAQGMYAYAGIQEVGIQISWNFVFTSGKYNGSTLSVLAQDPIFHMYREMPIVGGSGVFRLARGIATAQTYSANITSLNAVLEFHVIVIHY